MIFKITERLKRIDFLIKTKSTGSPKQLAKKLGINERAWYKMRDELVNDLELPIKYCSFRNSYYYEEEGTFEIGFKKLGAASTQNIKAGFTIFSGTALKVQYSYFYLY